MPAIKLRLRAANFLEEVGDPSELLESWSWHVHENDEPLKSGPECSRVRVSGFDIKGNPVAPIRLYNSNSRRKHPKFGNSEDYTDPDRFRLLNVFAVIQRAIDLIEAKDTVGRRLEWSFGEKPLDVQINVAADGIAEYDRPRGALKFSLISKPDSKGSVVSSADSPDTIVHEIAHAIIDAIAPDLANTIDPQSRGIHEGLADLLAVFFAFESKKLRSDVLKKTTEDISATNRFFLIAELVGKAVSEDGKARSLRDLLVGKTLNPNFHLVSEHPGTLVKDTSDRYELCQVLSSAILDAVRAEYTSRRERNNSTKPDDKKTAIYSLYAVSRKYRRAVFRGLDYLPRSNISNFLDLGRAIISADLSAYPEVEHSVVRDGILKGFNDRGIAAPHDLMPMDVPDKTVFVGTDMSAFQEGREDLTAFVFKNRGTLPIGSGCIEDELRVTVRFQDKELPYTNKKTKHRPEWVVKLAWKELQPISLSTGEETDIAIELVVGSTIVVDAVTQEVKFFLTSDRSLFPAPAGFDAEQNSARIKAIEKHMKEGSNGMNLTSSARKTEPHWYFDEIVTASGQRCQILRFANMTKLLHAGH